MVPRGVETISFNLVSTRLGFFGSGNTRANISTVMRNPADLRGGQLDIVSVGRRNWAFDTAMDVNQFKPTWGPFPDLPGNGEPN